METGGSDWDVEWSIGSDHGLVPAVLVVPLDSKHVVRVALAKVVIFLIWLWSSGRDFLYLDVGSLQNNVRQLKIELTLNVPYLSKSDYSRIGIGCTSDMVLTRVN